MALCWQGWRESRARVSRGITRSILQLTMHEGGQKCECSGSWVAKRRLGQAAASDAGAEAVLCLRSMWEASQVKCRSSSSLSSSHDGL